MSEKIQAEEEKFIFEEPQSILENAQLVKVFYPVFNIYLLMGGDNLNTLESLFLVHPLAEDEMRYIFSYIVKKSNKMPFISDFDQVSVEKYIQGIKIISEWIFNTNLRNIFAKEISLIEPDKIKKAKEVLENMLMTTKEEINKEEILKLLLSEAMRG